MLSQGIAVVGEAVAGRAYAKRPRGDHPVYTVAPIDQDGGPLCQEVRVLAVDAQVESSCSRP